MADRQSRLQALSDSSPALVLVAGRSLRAAVLHGGVTGAYVAEQPGNDVVRLTAATRQFLRRGFLLLRLFETKAAQHDPYPV